MQNKKCVLFFISCFIATNCFPHHINDFNCALERNLNVSPTRSFDMVFYFITHAYEICSAIDHLKPEVVSKLGIRCDGCKTTVLSCAEFGGHLCAAMGVKQMDTLKDLIIKGDAVAINLFMQTVANEQQFKCSECNKFVQWGAILGQRT
jgi:hypothetical protein